MLSVSSWGKRCSLHPWPLRLGLGPQTPRRKDSLPRRQERKETGGGGCGEEALCAFALFVGERRGLRAAAKHPPL
jgi:hypothetical protein